MQRPKTRDVLDTLEQERDRGWLTLTQRYGRSFRYLGGLVTAEPALVKHMLMERVHVERRAAAHRDIVKIVPGSAGILFKDGDPWLHRLRSLMPTFAPAAIGERLAEIDRQVRVGIDEWGESAEGDDLFEAVVQLGKRIVLAVGYNLDPCGETAGQLGDELLGYKRTTMDPDGRNRLDTFGLRGSKILDTPWVLAGLFGLRRRMRRVRHLVEGVLDEQQWLASDRKGWVEQLERELPADELVDEINHLYGAYNAIDYSLTGALLELSRHPRWVAELRAELRDGSRVRAELGAPERFPVMEAVMQECFRRYPVSMVIFRELGSSIEVDGETFEKGTQVMMLPFALHHDPQWWGANADVFDPSRWLEGGGERVEFSFIPFLRGARKCIGQHLAQAIFRIVVGVVVENLDLDVDGSEVRVSPYVIPRFDRPIRYRASRRSD